MLPKLITLSTLFLLGCQSETTPDRQPQLDVSTAGCGACFGCCSNGLCLLGNENDKCGTGGTQCQNCVLEGKQCQGGTCSGGNSECLLTCTGCCTSTGECKVGIENSFCGSAGGSCTDCSTLGQTCSGAKTCVSGPQCENCETGCCDGSTCKSGSDNNACGSAGGSCTDCTTQGLVCKDKLCISVDQSCTPACQPFQNCVSSKCQMNTTASFNLIAESAAIINQNWESFPELNGPDPYLKLSHVSGASDKEFKTPHLDSTYSPLWNHTLGPFIVSQLKNPVKITLCDYEYIGGTCDVISECNISFTDTDFKNGKKEIKTCNNPSDGKNKITSIKFRLEFIPPA